MNDSSKHISTERLIDGWWKSSDLFHKYFKLFKENNDIQSLINTITDNVCDYINTACNESLILAIKKFDQFELVHKLLLKNKYSMIYYCINKDIINILHFLECIIYYDFSYSFNILYDRYHFDICHSILIHYDMTQKYYYQYSYGSSGFKDYFGNDITLFDIIVNESKVKIFDNLIKNKEIVSLLHHCSDKFLECFCKYQYKYTDMKYIPTANKEKLFIYAIQYANINMIHNLTKYNPDLFDGSRIVKDYRYNPKNNDYPQLNSIYESTKDLFKELLVQQFENKQQYKNRHKFLKSFIRSLRCHTLKVNVGNVYQDSIVYCILSRRKSIVGILYRDLIRYSKCSLLTYLFNENSHIPNIDHCYELIKMTVECIKGPDINIIKNLLNYPNISGKLSRITPHKWMNIIHDINPSRNIGFSHTDISIHRLYKLLLSKCKHIWSEMLKLKVEVDGVNMGLIDILSVVPHSNKIIASIKYHTQFNFHDLMNYNNWSPLSNAARYGTFDTFRYILDHSSFSDICSSPYSEGKHETHSLMSLTLMNSDSRLFDYLLDSPNINNYLDTISSEDIHDIVENLWNYQKNDSKHFSFIKKMEKIGLIELYINEFISSYSHLNEHSTSSLISMFNANKMVCYLYDKYGYKMKLQENTIVNIIKSCHKYENIVDNIEKSIESSKFDILFDEMCVYCLFGRDTLCNSCESIKNKLLYTKKLDITKYKSKSIYPLSLKTVLSNFDKGTKLELSSKLFGNIRCLWKDFTLQKNNTSIIKFLIENIHPGSEDENVIILTKLLPGLIHESRYSPNYYNGSTLIPDNRYDLFIEVFTYFVKRYPCKNVFSQVKLDNNSLFNMYIQNTRHTYNDFGVNKGDLIKIAIYLSNGDAKIISNCQQAYYMYRYNKFYINVLALFRFVRKIRIKLSIRNMRIHKKRFMKSLIGMELHPPVKKRRHVFEYGGRVFRENISSYGFINNKDNRHPVHVDQCLLSNLSRKEIIISEKADGVRFHNIPKDIYPEVDIDINSLGVSAEYIEKYNLYMVYDICPNKLSLEYGSHKNPKPFERINYLREKHKYTKTITDTCKNLGDLTKYLKEERKNLKIFIEKNNGKTIWWPKSAWEIEGISLFSLLSEMEKNYEGNVIPIDGWIITPDNGTIGKFKPQNHLSIDLLFDGNKWITGDRKEVRVINNGRRIEPAVWRCYWNNSNECWEPGEIRYDRKKGNDSSIEKLLSIQNEYRISSKDYCDFGNVYYMSANTISKKTQDYLLNQKKYLNDVINEKYDNCLEIGCGKGGTLSSWGNRYRYLVGIDIDPSSIWEFNKKEGKNKIGLVTDFTQLWDNYYQMEKLECKSLITQSTNYASLERNFDVVLSNFSFHYARENYQIENLMREVNKRTSSGSVFVINFLDSDSEYFNNIKDLPDGAYIEKIKEINTNISNMEIEIYFPWVHKNPIKENVISSVKLIKYMSSNGWNISQLTQNKYSLGENNWKNYQQSVKWVKFKKNI